MVRTHNTHLYAAGDPLADTSQDKLDERIDRVTVPTLSWPIESVEVRLDLALSLTMYSREPQDIWNSRKGTYTHYEKAQAWDKAAKKVEEVSEEMVRRWSNEIDTLLVFVRPLKSRS